jgi:hypothetical protein
VKLSLILMSIFALFAPVSARGSDDIPKKVSIDRYSAMLTHSPFAVASAPSALPAATPNFAKDLYVSNAAKLSESDMVTLASSADKNFKEYLTTKGPNEHGYAIASIEWSEKVGATKVTISKDGQFAPLTFNQALISSGPPMTGPQTPNVVPPGGSTPGQNVGPRAPVTNLPTPPPHVRGVIPRNPSAAPAPVIVPPPADN